MTQDIEMSARDSAQNGPRDKPGYGIDPDYVPAGIPSDEGLDQDGPPADPAGEDVERPGPAESVERQSEAPPDDTLPSDP